MNIDITQTVSQNPAAGAEPGNGTFNWTINKILHHMINHAKNNAETTADQLKLLKWLIEQFTYLAELMIGGFHPGMSQKEIAAKLEKIGGFINFLMNKAKDLPPSLRKQISGFTNLLKTTLKANEYIYEGTGGGKVPNPINVFLLHILNGKDENKQALHTDAYDAAGAILHGNGPISKTEWLADINNSLTTAAMFVNDQATGLGTMSQIVEAKLTQALNVIQELLDAAGKLVDKQFKVELQMQGRIKAQ